jgi:glycosyltransferase involved in cell wall biosynthesis
MNPEDIVILSTADWDNPFWTNKQHVAVELARRGHRVFYIDSLGLRRPSASRQDLRRIGRRLRKAVGAPRQVRDHVWVWSPIVIPLQGNPAARGLNRALLSRGLAYWLGKLGQRAQILWTYNPMTLQLLDVDPFEQLVYHCVDDISAQPGMPSAALTESEQALVRRADVVFVTSPKLLETRRTWNPNTVYFPNVADSHHFSKALDEATEIPPDIAALPRPRIGFVGAISGYKLDFGLIRHLAQSRPDWSIVLIGKVGEGDPWTDTSLLTGLPNLHILGPREYATLPGYLRGMDVAMLPSRLNDYTESMFPMKFFEYLAAGKPVVSTALPALADFCEVVALSRSQDEFVEAISAALDDDIDHRTRRLSLARNHSYVNRTEAMLTTLRASGAGSPDLGRQH